MPIFAETLKKHGVYDKNKLIGVTTSTSSAPTRFVAENQGKDVRDVKVDVIGGHAGTTIIPLLSQVPGTNFSDADIEALTQRIMFGGDEVVKAKDGAGSATLSMAYAGAHFTSQLLKALDGQTGIHGVRVRRVQRDRRALLLDARDARPRRRGRKCTATAPYRPTSRTSRRRRARPHRAGRAGSRSRPIGAPSPDVLIWPIVLRRGDGVGGWQDRTRVRVPPAFSS